MARYDILLVNAIADSEMAEMVARRLKALKFKVRHDRKREHTTPTPRDYRDADNSQSVLVLWSESACDTSIKDSDWVHAIAHHARSKDGVLVQVGLDNSVPDEPFAHDKRYMLEGLTARKTVDGYYDLVDDIGKRDGRKDLRAWIDMKASDKDGKEAWKKKHPTDPLALVGQPKPKPAAGLKKAAALEKSKAVGAAAAGAAALASTAAAATPKAQPAATAAAVTYEPEEYGIGWGLLFWVLAGIVAMLLLGWLFRSKPGLPAAANAGGVSMVAQCPAGQMPAYLLDDTLRTGPITDDTGG